MTKTANGRVKIRRVGLPGEAALELRGTVLLFHKRSWVAASTMFIPVEWVEIQHARRRDLRRLYQGVIAWMAALLFAMPLSLILLKTELVAGLYPSPALMRFSALALTLFLLACAGVGLWSLAMFAPRRETTELTISGAPRRLRIHFWHPPGKRPELDALVTRLAELRGAVSRHIDHPVRMNHVWRRPRPYRVALLKGLAVSFLLYLIVMMLEFLRLAGRGPELPRLFYLFLVAPPASYLLRRAAAEAWRLREPEAFRRGLRCYRREEADQAIGHLRALVEQHPEHQAGRLLLTQACTETGAFDEALRHCEYLDADHPMLARQLRASIWGIRRMHERMHPDDSASGAQPQ